MSGRERGSAEGKRSPLAVSIGTLTFQNPIVLAAGTAGYGRELEGVLDLDRLGGLVTKAVSVEPRAGAPSPRVAEFEGGMINAVGLANPGLDSVRRDHLPWLQQRLARSPGAPRALVNVVGNRVEDFVSVVEGLNDVLGGHDGAAREGGVCGFELNVSCPNVKAGGLEFGADPGALTQLVRLARAATTRPLFVKLSPALADIAATARVAADAGADGITVVNTLPGLVIDVEQRKPALGFGSGGVSGVGLLPVGVLATWKVHRATGLPILGLGGVSRATDALQYLLAGATLVGVGTAAMRDPRLPERLVADLEAWCRSHRVSSLQELIGQLEWPT